MFSAFLTRYMYKRQQEIRLCRYVVPRCERVGVRAISKPPNVHNRRDTDGPVQTGTTARYVRRRSTEHGVVSVLTRRATSSRRR
jgi:hypothetical protein